MPEPSLKADAERVQKATNPSNGVFDDMSWGTKEWHAARRLAEDKLRECDETPVDEAWLKSVGFRESSSGREPERCPFLFLDVDPDVSNIDCGGPFHICVGKDESEYAGYVSIGYPDDSEIELGRMSRGQVLRLMDALGVNSETKGTSP